MASRRSRASDGVGSIGSDEMYYGDSEQGVNGTEKLLAKMQMELKGDMEANRLGKASYDLVMLATGMNKRKTLE